MSPLAFSFYIETNSNTEFADETTNIYSYHKTFELENSLDHESKEIFFKSDLESFDKPSFRKSEVINFTGQSNNHIYIVKITSSDEIHFDNFDYYISLKINGIKECVNSGFEGCFFVNETFIGLSGAYVSGGTVGNLRYFHLNLTKRLKYTYEDRRKQIWDNTTIQSFQCPNSNITLPPGTWYFIFTGLIFDLQQEDFSPSIKVWMNISSNDSNIVIFSYEGGKQYGIWYGEYNANFIISRYRTFEMMLNGKFYFNVTNNFLFRFLQHPSYHGFLNIKWDTPNGKKKFHMKMREGRWYYKDDFDGIIYGLGPKGEYDLTTSYLDYSPEKKRALVPYFIGLDIELR